jgi:hypothetical protein
MTLRDSTLLKILPITSRVLLLSERLPAQANATLGLPPPWVLFRPECMVQLVVGIFVKG